MQREEPYLPLTLTESCRDGALAGPEKRCGMVPVVSSCREMLG